MPIYVYEEILEDGTPGEVFEVLQRMVDEAMLTHPKSGRPVRRVLQPPSIPFKSGGPSAKTSLDDGKLARLGFTKYQKASDGRYEKAVGTGPDLLKRGVDF